MLGGMGGERDRVVCLRWCGWGVHEGLVMYSVTDHGCVQYGWLWITTVAAYSRGRARSRNDHDDDDDAARSR